MNKQRNNDEYNHLLGNEIEQKERFNNKTGSKTEQRITPTPNRELMKTFQTGKSPMKII